MEERNIRLIVAYDGTDLHGYQRQKKHITVQEELEKALSKVCNEDITVYGSSRTDSGVHAKYQVITFFTKGNIPVENLKRALIAFLPLDIVVQKAEEVPIDWRPRWNTFGKKYSYTIHNHELQNPLTRRYHWHVKYPLDIELMQKGARLLEGTHNFTTLAGTNSTPQDPVKTIYMIHIEKNEDKIVISVLGDGFLYHMVRNIAGLLVDIGRGHIDYNKIPELLEKEDRRAIGKTAPPQGLCLEKVYFSEEERDKDIQKYIVMSKIPSS